MLFLLSSPVVELTDGGLKCFFGVNVKVSGLKGSACWSSTTSKLTALWITAAVL